MNTKQKPRTGEIWIADLGMIGKIRPVLILYYPNPDDSRMLVIVAPLTSQIRGCNGEIDITHIKWLPKPSAINIQGLASVDKNCLSRKLGILPATDFNNVKSEIKKLLNL